MMEAIWNGTVIARSEDTLVVEGNHYFPRDSLTPGVTEPSATSSHCPWKGDASYYTLLVDNQRNADAAWYYADPKDAAAQIRNRVAFWKGVEVREV